MFSSLYPRLKALAEGPRAEAALAAVAFAESSFFPIPPDVLLAPMALAKPGRAWRYALIASLPMTETAAMSAAQRRAGLAKVSEAVGYWRLRRGSARGAAPPQSALPESSFFPIPPDVLLAPMALAKPARAWRYALIATVASVIGGMLGYAIGAMLFDTVGQWLINLYGYGAKIDALKQTYAQWGWLVILVKGMTPIPYKLVTIVSGVLGYNFPLFVALSIVTRGARFFIVAGALHWFGEPLRLAMERNFAAVLGGFAALIVAGFVIAIKVF